MIWNRRGRALIGRYFKEECDADFVFVTHYPSKKRPFYAMDDPEDPTLHLSFDLLFQGLEITTGGQRIHDYHELLAKDGEARNDREGMEQYLSAFKHGMPPHGGLGIGMERLTMQLMDEDNVRETTLFPRDLSQTGTVGKEGAENHGKYHFTMKPLNTLEFLQNWNFPTKKKSGQEGYGRDARLY